MWIGLGKEYTANNRTRRLRSLVVRPKSPRRRERRSLRRTPLALSLLSLPFLRLPLLLLRPPKSRLLTPISLSLSTLLWLRFRMSWTGQMSFSRLLTLATSRVAAVLGLRIWSRMQVASTLCW